ncbi:GTPase-activating protein, variant 2 [Basidiobolus ranarum]
MSEKTPDQNGLNVFGAQYSHGTVIAGSDLSNSYRSGGNSQRTNRYSGRISPTDFIDNINQDWDSDVNGEVHSSKDSLQVPFFNVQNLADSDCDIEGDLSAQLTRSRTPPPKTSCTNVDLSSSMAKPVLKSKMSDSQLSKYNRLKKLLQASSVDLAKLQELCWNGIPEDLRPTAWQLMLGYLPCNAERRAQTLARKRKEYEDAVAQTFSRGEAGLDEEMWHQITIDVPRTNSEVALYRHPVTQECLKRILYCWAVQHPASGYVQGINDLVTPFFQVFLTAYTDEDPENFNISTLSKETLSTLEADTFWCLTKLLDGIQDNYTFAQPGIQRQIFKLREFIERVDAPLAAHLAAEGVEYIQFTFRWMNCLLLREIPMKATIRMWDTYLAEGETGFSDFHLYMCAAFLVYWSEHLKKLEFQDIIMFLQSLPTQNWTDQEIEMLLSQAYIWKTLFHNAPNHFGH